MARNKESLVLLLDVGPSMHHVLPDVEKICSILVQKKLIYGWSDDVGVVLFGTDETNNDLEKEVGGYEYIMVLCGISIVNKNLSGILQNLPRGNAPGDFLDAIVVGMDLLIRKFGPTNRGKMRICLITGAQNPTKEPYEGTKEDQVSIISEQLKSHGIKLDCIITRIQSGLADQEAVAENDSLLFSFSNKGKAKVTFLTQRVALLGALRTRNISAVTVFRGDFELSSTMKIKIWVYKKTSEERFPTLKKYSDKAPGSDRFATHEVKLDYEYKSIEDPNKIIPPEQRIRGYRYGPQIIPVSSDEWEAVKFRPEKSVKLLGFTDASNIHRHYFLKDVYSFIPEPGNKKAAIAVSSIARAMRETEKVAILRCVWRQGQGSVTVGVLTPNLSSQETMPDSFYFNVLPFAEDVREFQFPSFSGFPTSWLPNEQQQEAADNLVKSLDLAPEGRGEMLMPDLTPNPVLERFFRFLELKSTNPDTEVPPLDPTLREITEPDPDLLSSNKSLLNDFRLLFDIKRRPKWKDSKRSADENPEIKIGDKSPVREFEAMMGHVNGSDSAVGGIRSMKIYVHDLLENSYEGDAYPKAMDCLLALRKACVLEQEPKEFNQFLREIFDRWKATDLRSFLELLASKNISLISKTESPASDASDEEARSFLIKAEAFSQ
ncbi:ku80 family protein [Wolffia australiana]